MARNTPATTKCFGFAAAMKLTAMDEKKLHALADKYGTTDITADYLSAAQDLHSFYSDIANKLEGPKFSKGAAAGKGQSAAAMTRSLMEFMNMGELGRSVVIVDSAEDLSDVRDLVAFNTKDAVAWTRDGKAYLIADRIAKGDERAVFMHEVGVHLGLERMLTKEHFKALTGKLAEWVDKGDGSVESELSKKALERVYAANTNKADIPAEHLAYFIEEAMKAGLDPTASTSKPFAQWWRTLWAAFKSAVRKLGLNPDKLTAQDVVNMAYGAARLETQGKWHGTAAEFRKFNHDYMGSGEGAQAYGWGTYMAERRGIGKGYYEQDVGRKAGTKTVYNGTEFDVTTDEKGKMGWGMLETALKWAYPNVSRLDYISEGLAEGMSVERLKAGIKDFTSAKDRAQLAEVLSKITQTGARRFSAPR